MNPDRAGQTSQPFPAQRRRGTDRVGALVLCLLGFASACRSTQARHLEGEVQSLSRHIDALRDAPNEQKSELLARLEQQPAKSGRASELKALCVDAYRKHVTALTASGRARELLATKDGGPAAALEAAKQITLSESELSQARELTERCVSLQGQLRREAQDRAN
ncbi:MAG TPA: hypothetical protein VFQ61_38160 [Polyangiaceae bacterium]|nr:hypothetical protein [Polyangiaceae bacterium]